jgi:hypothetical protein
MGFVLLGAGTIIRMWIEPLGRRLAVRRDDG